MAGSACLLKLKREPIRGKFRSAVDSQIAIKRFGVGSNAPPDPAFAAPIPSIPCHRQAMGKFTAAGVRRLKPKACIHRSTMGLRRLTETLFSREFGRIMHDLRCLSPDGDFDDKLDARAGAADPRF